MDAHSNTQTIDTILKTVMRCAKQRGRTLGDIQHRWSQVVGTKLSKHSKPVSLRHGLLVVDVDQPGDNYALSLRKQELLEQLQGVAEGAVKELLLRPGMIKAKQPPRKIKRSLNK